MTFLRGEGCGLLSKELKSFVHCLSSGQYLVWSAGREVCETNTCDLQPLRYFLLK